MTRPPSGRLQLCNAMVHRSRHALTLRELRLLEWGCRPRLAWEGTSQTLPCFSLSCHQLGHLAKPSGYRVASRRLARPLAAQPKPVFATPINARSVQAWLHRQSFRLSALRNLASAPIGDRCVCHTRCKTSTQSGCHCQCLVDTSIVARLSGASMLTPAPTCQTRRRIVFGTRGSDTRN